MAPKPKAKGKKAREGRNWALVKKGGKAAATLPLPLLFVAAVQCQTL